jgi:hypothetical protein
LKVGTRATEYSERMEMPWQARALRYIDLIPELNYASRFYARMLKQLRIYPATLTDQGDLVPIEEGLPVEALNRIQDPGGGKSGVLSNYGRLMFSTGEGNLFGYDLETDDEAWVFVWNDELEVDRETSGEMRKVIWTPAGRGSEREFTADDAVVYKFWTPHPRRSGEADSPMRSVVEGDIAEELIALTRSVRATAVSRTVNGLFILPQEISPPALEAGGDEDPLNNIFIADLAEHLTAQIEQAGSAAAAAPYVLEAAYEYADRIRWMALHDPQTDYMERDLRKEAVERMARGMDFPPEALLGLGSTNHWAALQILMDMWRSHGAPVAEQFCDDLNMVYLRPALRDAEYEDWRSVVIAYDESQVVVKPDRSDDALRAFREGALSEEGLRKMLSIPEDFAPSEEERDRYLAIKLRDATIIGGEAPASEEAPPPPGPEGDSGRRTRITGSAGLTRELGAAEMALMRCRELAGSRIRHKSRWTALERRCADCAEQANGKPNETLASVIGAELLVELGADPLSLVKGGADNFHSLLTAWGYSEDQAAALSGMIEVWAAKTLYDERFPALPPSFSTQLEKVA